MDDTINLTQEKRVAYTHVSVNGWPVAYLPVAKYKKEWVNAIY